MNEKKNDNETIEKEEKENKVSKFNSMNNIPREIKSANRPKIDEYMLLNANLNSANIKKDLLIFKDEILKEIKKEQIKIIEKENNNEKYTMEKLEEFSKKIDKHTEKIDSLSNKIITDKSVREKVESLIEFKNKNQEIIMTNGIKIQNLDKDLYSNIYRIESILKETVLHPRIIGGISKFQTFHDFMDFLLAESSKNITFREKTILDINNLRINNDKMMNNLTNKIDKAKKTLTLYIDTKIKSCESKINSLNDTFNDRITNYRIENMTYLENMKKTSESLQKQINSVIQAKNDILNKFEEKMKLANKDNIRMKKYFTEYKNEFTEMNRLFKEMLDALNAKNFNFNNNNGLSRKINKLIRRQTMINKDIKDFEINIAKPNKIVHSINMNDMFGNNQQKVTFNNDILEEKEKINIQPKILKQFKRINTASVRVNRFFEKENILEEKKKKNEDIKKALKKKHRKKIKILNEIYLVYNSPMDIDIIKRKLNKYNSICVTDNKLKIKLKGLSFESKANINKTKVKTMLFSNNKKVNKKKQLNLFSDYAFNTSISKSQNSIFSQNSEKAEEDRKNQIKKKYQANLMIKETNEINLSKTLEKESLEKIEKKELEEAKNTLRISKTQNNNIFEIQKLNDKLEIKKQFSEKKKLKEENKLVKYEIKKNEQLNSLNKIYITIEGSNKIELDANTLQKNKIKKDILNNVNNLINNKKGKTLKGYPKILTNNGENIIYSPRPIFNKQNYASYENPNIAALKYSIYNLYEKKMSKTRNKYETNSNSIFQNKRLISQMKVSDDYITERNKKAGLTLKSSNFINKSYLSQKE